MPGVAGRSSRSARYVPGIAREDSDDELGTDDIPWEWIYEKDAAGEEPAAENGRKRKRATTPEAQIIGARMGSFECHLGDTMLLKAEGSNEAWVGIICDFQVDEDGDKAACFMWFSSPDEIRNPKKRTDFLEVSGTVLAAELGRQANSVLAL
jgi:origin recognition complex subunit 1